MRSTLFRALLALAAVLALSSTLLAAPATSATTDRATAPVAARAPGCIPNCWVAVSFNTVTFRGGWTQKGEWGTKTGAMRSAFTYCKRRRVNADHWRKCVAPSVKNTVTKNGCVAVAWLTRNGRLVRWTQAKAYGPIVAQRRARKKLDGRGTKDTGYACSPRRF